MLKIAAFTAAFTGAFTGAATKFADNTVFERWMMLMPMGLRKFSVLLCHRLGDGGDYCDFDAQ